MGGLKNSLFGPQLRPGVEFSKSDFWYGLRVLRGVFGSNIIWDESPPVLQYLGEKSQKWPFWAILARPGGVRVRKSQFFAIFAKLVGS